MGNVPYRIHIRQGEFELDVEGDRGFVESYIEAFMSDAGSLEEAAPGLGKRAGAPRRGKGSGRRTPVPEIDVEALNAFISPRSKTTNKERYLIYTKFWINQGLEEVADAHVQSCFEAQGLAIPPTGRQNFSTLRDEGLIVPGSKRGTWALSAKAQGEAAPKEKAASKGSKAPKKRGKKGGRAKSAKGPAPAAVKGEAA